MFTTIITCNIKYEMHGYLNVWKKKKRRSNIPNK